MSKQFPYSRYGWLDQAKFEVWRREVERRLRGSDPNAPLGSFAYRNSLAHAELTAIDTNQHHDWTAGTLNFLTSGSVRGATGWLGGASDNLQVSAGGILTFSGAGRINWQKIAPASVTLSAGTTANLVADLTSANDGNVYDITEAAATPGQTLIVDFESVEALAWVRILATYEGLATHALEIELYNWDTTAWDHFESMQTSESYSGTIFGCHCFMVADQTNYIGTGANEGDVRVRFNHPMAGNASHHTFIDVVSLYH